MRKQAQGWLSEIETHLRWKAEILEQGRAETAVEAAEYEEFFGRMAREMRGRRAFFAETFFPEMDKFDRYAAEFQNIHDELKGKKSSQVENHNGQVENSQENDHQVGGSKTEERVESG